MTLAPGTPVAPHELTDLTDAPILKMVGASGQLSLGKQYAGRCFEVETQPDGGILVRPKRVIPEAEAWLHTPEMREHLARAEVCMAENPPGETDLDELAARLEAGG